MKIINLASGSGGNCTIIRTKNTTIMLDCGISNKQVKQRLLDMDIVIDKYDALIITHEHGDHIGSIGSITRQNGMEIYMNHKSFNAASKRLTSGINIDDIFDVNDYEAFMVNDVKITPILLSHDVANCFGYVIEHEDTKLVYCTDTGYVLKRHYPIIENANMYMMESNHDPELLLYSQRPYMLKQRIMSTTGHLSNEDACNILNKIVGDHTKYIMLMHLSRECNDPDTCMSTYDAVFNHKEGIKTMCAKQDRCVGVLEI